MEWVIAIDKYTERKRQRSRQNNSQLVSQLLYFKIWLINVQLFFCLFVLFFHILSHNYLFSCHLPKHTPVPTKSNRLQLGQIIIAFSSVVMAH